MFSVKGRTVSILGRVDRSVCVTTTPALPLVCESSRRQYINEVGGGEGDEGSCVPVELFTKTGFLSCQPWFVDPSLGHS